MTPSSVRAETRSQFRLRARTTSTMRPQLLAIARVLEVQDSAISAGLESVEPAFGRQELVQLEGRRLRLLLGKNPAGADQLLTFLASVGGGVSALRVAVLLNDRFADSRDVSWIWDVNFEGLSSRVGACWSGGDRAEEMALRLKYAGWPAAATPFPQDSSACFPRGWDVCYKPRRPS